MFRAIVFGAVLGCGALYAGTASAEPYISASIGGSFRPIYKDVLTGTSDPNGVSLKTATGAAATYQYARQTRFQTGLDAEAALGFRFKVGGGAIRTELNVEYGQYYAGQEQATGIPNSIYTAAYSGQATLTHGGMVRHGSATFNAFYDFPKIGPVIPYLGAGVGYAVSAQEPAVFNGGDTITTSGVVVRRLGLLLQDANVTHTGLYMAEVGVAIPVTKNLAVVPSYRYSQLFNGQAPLNVGKVGVRYDFN